MASVSDLLLLNNRRNSKTSTVLKKQGKKEQWKWHQSLKMEGEGESDHVPKRQTIGPSVEVRTAAASDPCSAEYGTEQVETAP